MQTLQHLDHNIPKKKSQAASAHSLDSSVTNSKSSSSTPTPNPILQSKYLSADMDNFAVDFFHCLFLLYPTPVLQVLKWNYLG